MDCDDTRSRQGNGENGCPLNKLPRRRLSVAPMLDWTDRHYRFFARLITRHARLYTEMVTTGALIHGNVPRHLEYDATELPLALQLGGSNPTELAYCTKLAFRWGYNEVNLNIGCPSERVQQGAFGACLMAEANLVADCVKAMRDTAPIDVTVKHRIGINAIDSYDFLADFVETIAAAGCRTFIVHARNAILHGLSPKQNREIPPLKYDYVYRLKRDKPELEIILNGGVRTQQEIDGHLEQVDGVMVGREAYHNPWVMVDWDARYYGAPPNQSTRADVVMALLPYIKRQRVAGRPLRAVTRHILGLFQGVPGARHWRRLLSDASVLKESDEGLILRALEKTLYA